MPAATELPYSFCKRFGIVASTALSDGKLCLITRSQTSADAISEAQRLLGLADNISVESDQEFNRLLSQHFEKNRETSFDEAEKIGGELNLDDVARELAEPEDLLESDDDAPIIRLINALITEAIKENASDIHVEPYEKDFRIRFRIDGILYDVSKTRRNLCSRKFDYAAAIARSVGLPTQQWRSAWIKSHKTWNNF